MKTSIAPLVYVALLFTIACSSSSKIEEDIALAIRESLERDLFAAGATGVAAPAFVRGVSVKECRSDGADELLCQAVVDVARGDGRMSRAVVFFSVRKESNGWVAAPSTKNRGWK